MMRKIALIAAAATALCWGGPLSAQDDSPFGDDKPAAAAAPFAEPGKGYAPLPGAMPATSVTRDMIGADVVVEGIIVRTIPSSRERTPSRIIIAEKGGTVFELVYWVDLAKEAGLEDPPNPGAAISARGKLEDYRGTMQIRIRTLDQICVEGAPATYAAALKGGSIASKQVIRKSTDAPPPASAPTPAVDGYFSEQDIPRLSALMGRRAAIKGKVSKYTPAWNEKAPNIVEITDGNNPIEVVFWNDPGQKAEGAFSMGDPVYAVGDVAEHKEKLQLKAYSIENVSKEPLAPNKLPGGGAAVASAASTSAAPSGGGTQVASAPSLKWQRAAEADEPPARAMAPRTEPEPRENARPKATPAAKAIDVDDPAVEATPIPIDVDMAAASQMLRSGTVLPIRQIGPPTAGHLVKLEGKVNSVVFTVEGRHILVHDGTGLVRVNLPAGCTLPLSVDRRVGLVGIVAYDELRSQAELTVPDSQLIEITG